MRTDPDWPAVDETDLEAAAFRRGFAFDDPDALCHASARSDLNEHHDSVHMENRT